MSKRKGRNNGREKLKQIIELCKSVEGHSLNPFSLDIKESFRIMKNYYSRWEKPGDLCLDAETIFHLASVINLQSEWVKHHATALYTDPFLLQEKLVRMEKNEIVKIFFQVWQPMVELEQISIPSLEEAFKYWKNLKPLKERWKESVQLANVKRYATKEELVNQKILRDKTFTEELESLWRELVDLVAEMGENGKIRYWDFIGAESYEETAQKAFMTSFLFSYGYATLEILPLEEEILIKPYLKPKIQMGDNQQISIPIAVTVEDWRKWKRDQLQ